MRFLEFLEGKKTYIVAIVMAALNIAVTLNMISPENIEQINIILVALGIGALRSGINKI